MQMLLILTTEEGSMYSRFLIFLVVILSLSGSAPAAAPDLSGKLTLFMTGREQAIFEKVSVKFEKQFPRVRVRFAETEGTDPLKAVAEGTADVAVIGRMPLPEEKDFAGTVIGWEGIAIIVNASNRVMEVNLNQIGDIFSGKAKTWDEFGGLENKISVIEREPGKGVRPYLEQLLKLDGKMVNGKGVVEPDKEAVRTVSGSLNAVSYINLSAGLNNVTVGVPIRLLSINKVEPEPANVSSGAYPLRRPLVAVTKN